MTEIDILKTKEIALTLAKDVVNLKPRFALSKIELGKEPRIKVLRGFRGVGKTTLILQLMSMTEKAIYFSVDHPYFQEFKLYDLCKELVRSGYTTIMIDEIHLYPKWKRDTKALYDEFRNLNLILSGSAPLAFEPERRYEIIDVEPMSFREFLKLQDKEVENNDCWNDVEKTIRFLASNSWIYEYYQSYIRAGAFPIFFTYKEKTLESIYTSIRKSIREDAPSFSSVSGESIRAMEKLLVLLGTAKLGDFSVNSISKNLEITRYSAYEIVYLLESMRILRLVRPYGKGAKLVRGEPKLMFYHPNLRHAVCEAVGSKPDTGALREELAVFSLIERGWNVNTIKGMKRSPDYIIEKGDERIIVEVGGENKGRDQLKGFKERTLLISDRQLIILSLF